MIEKYELGLKKNIPRLNQKRSEKTVKFTGEMRQGSAIRIKLDAGIHRRAKLQ